MTLPQPIMGMPIIGLDWWISVRVTRGHAEEKIHSYKVHGYNGRYLGRLLCRWDEEPGEIQ